MTPNIYLLNVLAFVCNYVVCICLMCCIACRIPYFCLHVLHFACMFCMFLHVVVVVVVVVVAAAAACCCISLAAYVSVECVVLLWQCCWVAVCQRERLYGMQQVVHDMPGKTK